ncbi:MAG: SH3 domain-containing protein [Anaerolineae bacterium]|nr:SH3 domain-containing protein [Anaerolineae bacterium]
MRRRCPARSTARITDADQLNLRAAPSPAAAILNTIPRGTRLTLVGQCGDWYAAVTPAGEQGWVAVAYVTVAGVGFSAESGAASEALARNLPVIAASLAGARGGGQHACLHGSDGHLRQLQARLCLRLPRALDRR